MVFAPFSTLAATLRVGMQGDSGTLLLALASALPLVRAAPPARTPWIPAPGSLPYHLALAAILAPCTVDGKTLDSGRTGGRSVRRRVNHQRGLGEADFLKLS
jgi:hypothetical protein